jgi:gliding motility-associated-like protein
LSPSVSFSCNIDSTSLFVKPNATSVYTLVAKDSCGNIDTTTFEIKVEAIPVAVFAFAKTSFDITDQNISIINQSINATSYEWYFNGQLLSTSSSPLFPIVDTGLYCFKLVAKNTIGCSDTFDLCVNVVDTVVSNIVDQVSVYVPNAFSPNGDGKNDIFKPIFSGDVSSLRYKFAIYNRYGQQVFYTNNYQEGWNGTFQKMKCDLGYFYYYLQLGQNNLKGDVLVLR